MSSPPVAEVFDRAARLALRYGVPEIDLDILMLALDFEGGTAQPIDLSKIDAWLARYRRPAIESPEPSSRQTSGSGHSSGWIGLSSDVKAAVAPLGGLDAITIDSLRTVLLAAQNNKAADDRHS